MPATIKQWETSQDGIPNLKQTTAPLPIPGPNEVLVKISAVSINYRDTEVTMGLYNHHKVCLPLPGIFQDSCTQNMVCMTY